MKIAGVELTAPGNIIIPIVRGDQEIIFQASCIIDYSEMDSVLKIPEPKMRVYKGDKDPKPQIDSPEYKALVLDYTAQKIAWMVCKSLTATPGLEWETVDWVNPESWSNYEGELTLLGFNEFQINKLVSGVMEANGLSQSRIDEAKQRFLATRREEKVE